MIYKEFADFKQYLKRGERLIAVDYGTKKTGIATSDRLMSIASPYCIITTSSYNQLEHELGKILAETSPWGIVLGYPVQSDGNEGSSCHRVQSLARKFVSKFNLPIYLADERGTTAKAQDLLIKLEIKRKKRDAIDDKIAASIILQKILDEFKNHMQN